MHREGVDGKRDDGSDEVEALEERCADFNSEELILFKFKMFLCSQNLLF